MPFDHGGLVTGPSEKRVYTVPEFITAFSISRARLYEEINAGRLQARRIGRRTLIARADADAWVASLPTHRPALDRLSTVSPVA